MAERATFWSQLKALLWRNYFLKKRNKKEIELEIFFPVYFILLMVSIKALSKPGVQPAIASFPEHSLNDTRFGIPPGKKILITPDSPLYRNITSETLKYLNNVTAEYFTDQQAAQNYYYDNFHNVSAGIFFNYNEADKYSYALRFPFTNVPASSSFFPDITIIDPCRSSPDGLAHVGCDANLYLSSGFLNLQSTLDAVLLQMLGNSSGSRPDISVRLMPKAEYTPSLVSFQISSAIYFVLGYSIFINFLTTNIVAEKEKKIKEKMKMMGLRDSVFWLSWGLVYLIIMSVVSGIIVVIAFLGKLFSNSNLFILYLMLFLYGLTIISLSFALSAFFSNSQRAGIVTSFSSVIFSLLYLVIHQVTFSPVGIWFLCLLSPVAVAVAIDKGVDLDINNPDGMSFSSITQGDFPLYGALVMLAVDFVLYALLAVYLDHVIPGEYGVRYKPWYCFQSSYWGQSHNRKHPMESLGPSSAAANPNVELVTPELAARVAMRILGISKSFKGENNKKVFAVNDLSFDIYEGQITALLGHNGAGKTTLINMLTGLTPPTSGTATILGLDISVSGHMEKIRTMFGICPQHNILYEMLTCEEHLQIFAGIKGVPADSISQQVKKTLKDADLSDQANTFSENLSGGQKRKLSVAMAMIGDPKIVFLDEPTAGMDPFSRRHLWSLLKNNKKGRIILLTTHFMDEADILADRKVIISRGQLQCCGSSLFLKNRFGIGYHLSMVVDDSCNPKVIKDTLANYIPGIELQRVHGKEVAFTLPLSQISNFSGMFKTLEERGKVEMLGIKSYGVSMTTLEEVFLKLGEEAEAAENGDPVDHVSSRLVNEEAYQPPVGSIQNNVATAMVQPTSSKQFLALLKVRFLIQIRDRMATFFQLILPIVFIVVGLVIKKTGKSNSTTSSPAPLAISPIAYTKMHGGKMTQIPNFIVEDLTTGTPPDLLLDLNSTIVLDLYKSVTNLSIVAPHYLGMTINSFSGALNYTALYNASAIHGLPAILNLLSSTLLHLAGSNYSINATSLPWPAVEQIPDAFSEDVFQAAIFIGLAFIVIPANFATALVMDRRNKVRSQLRVSGVTFNMYWGSFYIFNLIIFAIPVLLSFIIIVAVQIDGLSSPGALVSLLLVLLTVIPDMLLVTYVVQFAFDKYETCHAVLSNVFLFAGLLPYLAVSLVDMLVTNKQVAVSMHIAFTVLDPAYILFGAFYYIDRVHRYYDPRKLDAIPTAEYFKASNNILICILMPLAHIVVFYILLRILDVRSTGGNIREALGLGKGSHVTDKPDTDVIEEEDKDVKLERQRIERLMQNGPGNQAFIATVQNLRKEFQKRGKTEWKNCMKMKDSDRVKAAVRNTTFGVERAEVFGLLGPNGAGKTTTMNMIIAEETPTKGQVLVAGRDVHSLSEAFQSIGYCPQHDPLWDKITLLEHLECYSAIKGIPAEEAKRVVDRLIDGLRIGEHSKKYASNLSGGTKRKLSYAMSMLGNPSLVLMDEPSTGMDPQSKRFLWDTISASFHDPQRGAILTTHYMEEADALCTRIGIMVNGKLVCLGSSQHLKNTHGSGYLLEVKLGTSQSESLETRMETMERHFFSLFPNAECAERFAERGQYKIPQKDVASLARVFAALEEAKSKFGIEEYSFSQSSLEQVFLYFAKKQIDDSNDLPKPSKSTDSQHR